jgi:electron transfer flavoprotein alpha subunit
MSALVIAEHDNTALKGASFNTIAAAAKCGPVTVLVAGDGCAGVADEAAAIDGVSKVLLCEAAGLKNPLAEPFAALALGIARDYTHLLAPATTFGKNLMPRIAALLDVQQISEITAVVDADTFERPIYAGNAIATVKSSDAIKAITVRATAFDAAAKGSNKAEIVQTNAMVAATANAGGSEFVGASASASERPELTQARIIVSGGRGMQSGDNFVMLERIADKLGAAVGASRAAVDSGFVPNDYQVGQTGKIVAPDLYIAVGISGAIQHLAGMKDSKVIVAINKDEEAPIFQVADYGLVGDLFKVLPDLEAELDK